MLWKKLLVNMNKQKAPPAGGAFCLLVHFIGNIFEDDMSTFAISS